MKKEEIFNIIVSIDRMVGKGWTFELVGEDERHIEAKREDSKTTSIYTIRDLVEFLMVQDTEYLS